MRFARVKVPQQPAALGAGAGLAALRAARGGHRPPPRPPLPGHGDRRGAPLPGHPQRRRRSATRSRPTTCSRRSRRSCASAASPPSCACEVVPEMPHWMRSLLGEELEVGDEEVYEIRPPLALARPVPARRAAAAGAARPALAAGRSAAAAAAARREARDVDIFASSGRRPPGPPSLRLVRRPACSASSSRGRRSGGAGDQADPLPHVARLADRAALIDAAERGKQVAVMVELKARFDEAAQHRMGARRSKRRAPTSPTASWASRPTPRCRWWCGRRPTALRCYAHLATGNYNAETAKLYTDLGLFTADRASPPTWRSCSTC